MAGNIFGNVNSTASLDGVTGSQIIQTNGSLINKASPVPLVAALSCSTWSRTSDTIGVFTVANTLTNGDKVAIMWAGGYVLDAVVSSSSSTVFTATVSDLNLIGGSTAQMVLPTGNTPVNISKLTTVTQLNIDGSTMEQLLVQSTQPSIVELVADSTVIQQISVITSSNGFYVWPTVEGQATPFSAVVTTAKMYNNSISTAITQIVALLD